MAALEAIKLLGYPLDRIVHAEVWATDTIPADLPPMVEFKSKADKIIKQRYGIDVEHICAVRGGRTSRKGSNERCIDCDSAESCGYPEKLTYEKMFYHIPQRKPGGKFAQGSPNGFPLTKGAWCNDRLKTNALDAISRGSMDNYGISCSRLSVVQRCTQTELSTASQYQSVEGIGVRDSRRVFSRLPADTTGEKTNIVQYLGIAADEPERIKRHTKKGIILPLVDINWDEAYCRQWCEENDLLSPIYSTAQRGGCWFCHNQGVDQLRLLRKNYPDLWALLLKWDLDSPTSFKSDGHTVHDYELRFRLEDLGKVPTDRKFRWNMVYKELERILNNDASENQEIEP